MPMSDYLRWLRSKVGRELLLLPSVTVLVRDDAGRLLITRNGETGELGFVGGGIEPGESPAEAGMREVKEETWFTTQSSPEVKRTRTAWKPPKSLGQGQLNWLDYD